MQKKKPIILTFVLYYLPGYKSGGPVRTIANMVEQLGDDLDFRIITSDRDARDQDPYPGLRIDDWNRVGKAEVYYVSPNQCSVWALAKLINATPHDVLYLNSYFDLLFTIKPLIARRLGWLPALPVVLAPRGEFSPGALEIKKWKKVSFLKISQIFSLYRNVTWQASSDYEAADIRRSIGVVAQAIVVAPDLPTGLHEVKTRVEYPQLKEGMPLRVVFISRISPKKNLDYALRVLAKVSVVVELHIYGFINDDTYWKNCQQLIHELPNNVSAYFHGEIDHAVVVETLSGYDLFFLPTRGENYGHVIFEALAAGVPVLISDQTPWRDLEQEAVGYMRPLNDENAFVEVIESQSRLGECERGEQAGKARSYAQRMATSSHVLEQNRMLFMDLLCGECLA